MAAHIVLPWAHRLFSNLKRWGLGVYTDCGGQPPALTSTSSCSASIGAEHGMPRSIRCSGIGARTAPAPYHVLIRKTA